jgi:hypothetical protein
MTLTPGGSHGKIKSDRKRQFLVEKTQLLTGLTSSTSFFKGVSEFKSLLINNLTVLGPML